MVAEHGCQSVLLCGEWQRFKYLDDVKWIRVPGISRDSTDTELNDMIDVTEFDEELVENLDLANVRRTLAISSSVEVNEDSGERMTTVHEVSENVPELNDGEINNVEEYTHSLSVLTHFTGVCSGLDEWIVESSVEQRPENVLKVELTSRKLCVRMAVNEFHEQPQNPLKLSNVVVVGEFGDKLLEQLRASHEAPCVAGTSVTSAGEFESLEQWQTSSEVSCVSAEFVESGQVKDLLMELQSENVSSRLASQDRAEVRVWESEKCVCGTQQVSQDTPGRHGDTESHARVATWHMTKQQRAHGQVWMMMDGKSRPLDVGPEEDGKEVAERWHKMTGKGDCDIRLMVEGRNICWDKLVDLQKGSVIQVLANNRGGMKKKSKKRKTNPWTSDEGSGERSSSAEEQFKELDKQELMENHKREMGNEHIDMLANMNTEQVEEMLMNFRENMSGVTEDQKTIAMMSLMWMVE